MEEVAREGNSEAVASTSDIATMRWALGALDTRAVVLSADFGVKGGALHVEGSYQNRGISLLDQLGGGGTSIRTHAGSVHLAQLDARVEAGVTTILRSSGLL